MRGLESQGMIYAASLENGEGENWRWRHLLKM